MQKFIRILLVAAVIALGVLVWRMLFPSPERVIRSRLKAIADSVSFSAKDGTFSKGYKAQSLLDYFTPEVDITVNIRGMAPRTFTGRDELIQALMWAQSSLAGLKVEFQDVNVTLGANKQTAVANLTGNATVSNDSDLHIQEFNVMLKKVDGTWKIYRVETVKTLSMNRRSAPNSNLLLQVQQKVALPGSWPVSRSELNTGLSMKYL